MSPVDKGGQAGARTSEEVLSRNPDDPLDELDELMERCDDRLAINNLALAKRYLKGELWVGLRLAGLGDWADEEYRAVLHGVLTIGGSQKEWDGFKKSSDLVKPLSFLSDVGGEIGVRRFISGPHRYDRLVFVENIELVEFPQGFVPTWVWLEPIDEPESLRARAAHSVVQGLRFEFGFVSVEREVRVFGGTAIGGHKSGSEQVKGRSKIVHDIADDGAPGAGSAFDDLDPVSKLAGLAVLIDEDQIGLAPVKGLDLPFKVVEMCFGSFDLHPHPLEGIVA